MDKEAAYTHQHATKPITLFYGLNDSPVGLCAWIAGKFYSWSDSNGNIENVFTKDELHANITLYWVSQAIPSSIRIYNENNKAPLQFNENDFAKPPVGIAKFPNEISFLSRGYIKRGYKVSHCGEFSSGAHFAAMEQPGLLGKDFTDFFREII